MKASNVKIEKAAAMQNATVAYTLQNSNIATAIQALKSITHHPMGTIENTSKLGSKNDYFGISEEDRKTIGSFISFLETKEMPMRQLFDYILNQE